MIQINSRHVAKGSMSQKISTRLIGIDMNDQHPNLTLLTKLNLLDLDASSELFSSNFVWHYFNPNLPDIEGDYIGIEGLKTFFKTIARKTNGSFKVEPVAVTPVGDELLVVQVRDSMLFEGDTTIIDVVVVWRIVDGKFVEAWDIPSAFVQAKK